MKRPPLSVALVLAVLVIAIWYGGKVPIGLPPAEGWFAAFLLERSHPWLAQAILALLIAVVGFVVSLKRTVHLAPTRALGICLLGAWVWIIVSSFGSKHPHASFVDLARWTLLFVWVQVLLSSLGRERYPTWVLSAFVAVVSLVALSGVQEYLSPSVPRNWRIFAGWHHPNAAASLFALA
ncbi:MAG: hypothetical protein D6724_10945, partial [Armatimonadetes bacterium]